MSSAWTQCLDNGQQTAIDLDDMEPSGNIERDGLGVQPRRRFFNSLYSNGITAPRADLPKICDYWRDALNADWVWFWLFNDLRKQWQLLASSPGNEASTVPSKLCIPDSHAVNDFVDATKQPVWVDDIAGWRGNDRGIIYQVAYSNLSGDLGCKAFQSIPLLPPIFQDRATTASSPIILRMTASAERERQISTVRHDLLAPMQMIRDTVEAMLPDPLPFEEDIPVHFKDLMFSAVTSFQLIPLLDPNPAEISDVEPKPIMLGGDIGGRARRNHLSLQPSS